MDVKRVLNTRIWADTWFENINTIDKLVWIYLLTNQNTNMLGIYELSSKRAAFELRINESKFNESIKRFQGKGKCFRINEYVFIPNWMKNQSMNPNMIKSAENSFNNLPKNVTNWLLDNKINNFNALVSLIKGLGNGLQTLRKYEKEIEKELEKELEKEIEERKGSKKGFIPPTLNEWIKYFEESGYKKDVAERSFRAYEVADWFDSTGKKVKNWKQKAINVWFKDENKRPAGNDWIKDRVAEIKKRKNE